jgi:uncharacterized protein with GYD domain
MRRRVLGQPLWSSGYAGHVYFTVRLHRPVRDNREKKETVMPRFLIQATFNQEAAKRLIQDGGTKRAAAVQELLKQHEARLENMYFSPQNDGPDAFAIIEVSVGGADALGALALAGKAGGITLTARRIFTPEELDKVAQKSKSVPVPGNW